MGFGEAWCERADKQSCHRLLVNQRLEMMFFRDNMESVVKSLLLKVLGNIQLSEKRQLSSILFLIFQSSVGCECWHRHWFKALLSLRDAPSAAPHDHIFWNSSSAFCMKMPVSSGETQKQKHDAVHVFIYGLSPQLIETRHVSVSDGEGKAPEMVMSTGRCCEKTLFMVFENMLQDVLQHDGMRDMLLAEKNLTRENWICDVFDSIFHISVPMSTAATSALAISMLTWRIIITAFPTCADRRQHCSATSKV